MSGDVLRELAREVTGPLSKADGASWYWPVTRPEESSGYGIDLCGPDGQVITLEEAVQPGRVVVTARLPRTRRTCKQVSVTAAIARGPEQVALDIFRRVLPPYRAELTAVREFERKAKAARDARVQTLHQAEALFGVRTEFGAYEPGRHDESGHELSVRLRLRGKYTEPGQRGPSTEFGRVTVRNGADLASLELRDVPAAVVLRMLDVLADYTAMLPPKSESEDAPEPAPVAVEFARLHDAWHENAEYQDMTWAEFRDKRGV